MGSAGGKKLADQTAPGEGVPGLNIAVAVLEEERDAPIEQPRFSFTGA